MKHPQLFTPLHFLPNLDPDITRRHLGHPDRHQAHQSNLRVRRFDEDERTCGQRREVFLSGALSRGIGVA